MDSFTDFKYKTLPSLEEIKRVGKNIRVHPNGFIQLTLEDGYRLHLFLDKEVYERFPRTPIHTHAFVLESRVMLGEVTNIEYEVAEDPHGDLCMYTAKNMESELEKVIGKTYSISNKKEEVIKVGEEYHVRINTFHESLHRGDTITIVRKIKKDSEMNGVCPIDILCLKGQTPVEGRIKVAEDVLWGKLETVLNNIG
jgi:hypothetical protein